jgi:DNA-binding MarR family transcriptional regulator
MGLQEDIKQTKFRNDYQKAAINILFTHGWLAQRIKLFLKNHRLTSQQYNVLRILRGSYPNPLSTLQIRERMLDKMSDSSRIVDRLVIKQLVIKKACEHDKRLVDVCITPLGLEKLAKIDEREIVIDQSLTNLSPAEAETLSDLLDKIRAKESS